MNSVCARLLAEIRKRFLKLFLYKAATPKFNVHAHSRGYFFGRGHTSYYQWQKTVPTAKKSIFYCYEQSKKNGLLQSIALSHHYTEAKTGSACASIVPKTVLPNAIFPLHAKMMIL
jgi:hypothetical protein